MIIKHGRIPAFSLLEMIVVLILSSMATTIVYAAFYIVFQYQQNLTAKYTTLNQKQQLYFELKKDFERYDEIIYTGEELTLSNHDTTEVKYLFSSDRIIRTHLTRIDTFHLQLMEAKAAWTLVTPSSDSLRVNHFTMLFSDPDTSRVSFTKWFDRTTLVQKQE